ncbi:MAG: type 1 glutamine amidotransferase [Calditrichaeota bacterium]|nr:type 1 glutamine amidotransferase [Calditrichota bacterium]
MAQLRYLIIDGYPKQSRDQFDQVGMTLAGQLYAYLLLKYQPDARYDIMYASDPGVELPEEKGLEQYAGVIWPGCNLTVYHDHDERVVKMVNLSKRSYETGVPQFGSCWGVQIAVYAAGGEVKPNPKGREMGIARKIHLTEEGLKHPMYDGKPPDGFISHDDEITKLPEGAKWLATNDFTRIQAVSVKHKNGIFWATQYHPEYNLREVARLIVAREKKLKKMGLFDNNNDFVDYVKKLEALAKDPGRKDIRWQLAIDDDLISESIIQCEFSNWLKKIVTPLSKGEEPESGSF